MSFFGNIDFNQLSETDRAIYHYLSSYSDKIPYMRVRDIANESHTSASSVMRFIRKLGYGSFTEFRLQFQSSALADTGFLDNINLLKLERFPRDIETSLLQVAEKIMTCENIVFFGIGASGSICEYAARRFATLGFNSYPMTDPTYPVHSKLKNTSDNLFVSLSISGTTTEVIEVANGFKGRNDYVTVAITSNLNSSLAKMSDFVLSYQIDKRRIKMHEDLTSQLPSMFLIEALSEAVRQLLSED